MPFALGKNAKELGIDVTRKFRVVGDSSSFDIGDIVTLSRDDNTPIPWFVRKTKEHCCHWSNLEYADEPKSVEPKSVESKHSFMSNILDLYRRIALSSDDRMMIELGLENPQGVPTEEGIKFWQAICYKRDRAEVIAAAQTVKAEQDKEKE